MKKFFTLLFGLLATASVMQAQDIDESYVFMDEDGNVIENGSTIVRNEMGVFLDGRDVIRSGVSVYNQSGNTAVDYLKVYYDIERIDNGSYQICFPSTCNEQSMVGSYETGRGQLMGNLQDIQSEWFTQGEGECIVTLTIEIMDRGSGFPPTYTHRSWGSSITVQFVSSSSASEDGFPYIKLADGVYLDGTTLYITSGVTSLGPLQVNPSEIYCYATIPPACVSNTFLGYGATLHVPAAGMVSYFTALYWYNFNNILSDAIEPLSVTMNTTDAEVEIGQQMSLSATVAPSDATPKTVYWSSTDPSVATVSNGGTVTAVAAGECDILATCVDKVAVCHVAVVPPRVTITLDKHEACLLPNHTLTLTATCSPIDVDLAVTSSNSGVAIPRLVNGTIMVVGVAEGTATITVNAADGWGNPDSCEVTVYTDHGDVNSDGYVNISDVTALIGYLLSGNPSGVNLTGADCNNNGSINISDVTSLINFLLSGKWPWESEQPTEPTTETFTVNGVSFKMVTVEGGTFTMGSSFDDPDASPDQKPAHYVTLSPYAIGQTEVTQALWLAVMGSNPSYFPDNLNQPVENVSWNDCQVFLDRLNQITGKQFRLPTEAEWEYAARGGNRSKGYKYAGSNNLDEVAWYWDHEGFYHPVGLLAPNELGIYDMSGNVWEYVQDWYGSYSSEAQTNPVGPVSDNRRVWRGGSSVNGSKSCRVTSRYCFNPSSKGGGLRLALDPDDSSKFRLSNPILSVLVGDSKNVSIIGGNGNYTVDGGADNATITIIGDSLRVTGTNEGTTSVYVTDVSSGATTVLTIIIKGSETFTVNGVSFTMVAVGGGTFMMGGTDEQDNDTESDEYPIHQVSLSSYLIGQTEVTQALWIAVMGSNPSGFTGDLKRPVESVSWDDCQMFITILNQMTGKQFRLPTEAEWEYAARGGNKSQGYKYAGSYVIGDVAWYYGNSNNMSHQIATKAPNEINLYDMNGNVWEWCQDRYYSYSSTAQTDPVGPSTGSDHVFRGGSYCSTAKECRVSDRNHYYAWYTCNDLGLRLAM